MSRTNHPLSSHTALPASAAAAGKSFKPVIYVASTTLLRLVMMNLCVSQFVLRREGKKKMGWGVVGGTVINHHIEFTTRILITNSLLLTAVFLCFLFLLFFNLLLFHLENSPKSSTLWGFFCLLVRW